MTYIKSFYPQKNPIESTLGITLSYEEALKILESDQAQGLHAYPLIQLVFPKFQDGRGYSIAYLLKTQIQYQGELRVVGKINPDQVSFLMEAGFDSIELEDESQWESFEKMKNVVRNRYQFGSFGIRTGRS
jgi:uncharacterized protein (DUF934 family)